MIKDCVTQRSNGKMEENKKETTIRKGHSNLGCLTHKFWKYKGGQNRWANTMIHVLRYPITRSYDHWSITGCHTEIKENKR